jgi:hypothetical protein
VIHLQLPESGSANFAGLTAIRRTGSVAEFYVPCSAFNTFMGEVNFSAIDVVLVETKRRDLEDFFLSLVRSGRES